MVDLVKFAMYTDTDSLDFQTFNRIMSLDQKYL